MAQSFQTTDGNLIIPGAYAKYTVQSNPSGLATNGVLMIVGEADAGPDYTLESDLNLNSFGPTQLADVRAKYQTGRIVNAFAGACQAANDPQIIGSFSKCIIVKTNPSTKASGLLKNFAAGTYATLSDKSYGANGNLINFKVTAKTAEVPPSTGPFAMLLPIASTNINVRLNGGTASAFTLGALQTPTTTVAALAGITGIVATGGVNGNIVAGPLAGTLALVVISGNAVQINCSVPFIGTLPVAGDTLYIPASSVLCTAAAANAGSYVVTGSSASQILATKLLDVTGAHNALTSPVNRTAQAIAAATDLGAYSAVTVKMDPAINPVDGLGKSLEIAELTTGTGVLSDIVYSLAAGVPTVTTWQSKASAPNAIVSSAEYSADLTDSRQLDGVTEDIVAGGAVALKIGYTGTTATLVNNGTTITITVTGGTGTSPGAINISSFNTIADFATYINSLTGFTCTSGTTIIGQQPLSSLDQGTFTICTTEGAYVGRIKQDAYKFYQTLTQNAILVSMAAQASSGLPAPSSLVFMAGGTKGGTTNANFTGACDALEMTRGNFLIPIFSRDATLDITDGFTDSSSSYTIATVHAYSRSHVLKMSTLKRRRNRQAFLSIRDTFANALTTAANVANFRCSMTFQDSKDVSASTGNLVQFQPSYLATKAASMQAAGFYRSLVKKGINVSGVLQAAGDFKDQSIDNMESALLSGLLPAMLEQDGTISWVSDQTTYGKDNNFVYNSIQAVYVSDVVALTLAQRLEQAFVGQSLADVSASLAVQAIDKIMADMFALKLIASSDDAPRGYKNVTVAIAGPAMKVSLEIKVATAIYFIPINILVSQIVQTANG